MKNKTRQKCVKQNKTHNHLNPGKKKKKTFDKNPTPFNDKNTQQRRNEKELSQPDKGYL